MLVTRWMTTQDDADKIGSFGFASSDPSALYGTLLRVDISIGRCRLISGLRNRMLLPRT
jgi:hypothetical protein